jgi:UDP-glucuronate decarboxylase
MNLRILRDDLKDIISINLPWNELEGCTILISGAAGFLPAYLVEALLFLNDNFCSRRIRVVGLVRNMQSAKVKFAHHENRTDLTIVEQNVTTACDQVWSADYIIHAASQASPKQFASDPVGTLTANVLGTHSLLSLGTRLDSRRLLFISSGEVYGQPEPFKIPTAENQYGYIDVLNVRSCYAEGKRASESLCVAWSTQFGLSTTIVRPFHTYGPGMRLDDGRVFADFVADVVACRPIRIRGDGTARRAFCYVADVAQGIFATLLLGKNAQAYNIGNESGECSIYELAVLLTRLFPERSSAIQYDSCASEAAYLKSALTRNCPDIALARTLGWIPWTDLEQGFEKTVRSFL